MIKPAVMPIVLDKHARTNRKSFLSRGRGDTLSVSCKLCFLDHGFGFWCGVVQSCANGQRLGVRTEFLESSSIFNVTIPYIKSICER